MVKESDEVQGVPIQPIYVNEGKSPFQPDLQIKNTLYICGFCGVAHYGA